MKTPAATPTPNASPAAPPARSPWQAPIFVLGVGALLAVYFGRPLWPCGFGQAPCRDLDTARAQLSRPDGDAELALKLATRALASADAQAEPSGEATFLIGSAHVRLAERAAPASGVAHWRKARQFLEQAEQVGVSDDDRPQLHYRLGKADLALGKDVPGAIRRLEDAIPQLNNRGEGYALLVRAYLGLPTPDLNKALEANKALREVVEISEADLLAAKLQGGELLLRLGRPAEARKSLEKIVAPAPASLLVKARLLEARSFQEEKQYGDAARLYQQALADNSVPIPEPERVYFALGLCYEKQEQPKEAARAWEECVRLNKAPESPAAAVLLADVRVTEGLPKVAVGLLERAVAKVAPKEGWTNPLIDRAAVTKVFERTLAALRPASGGDLALTLLGHYARLAPPQRMLTLRGDVRADLARERLQGAVAGVAGTGEKEALSLYSQAGDDYAEAAALPGLKASEQAELLWTSVSHYTAAREQKKAAERLEKLVTLDAGNERLAEAWYRMGLLREEAGARDEATKAYLKCIEHNTRFDYLARHRIALALLHAKKIDDAEKTLIQNVDALRFEADHEALTLSLAVLVDLLYNKRDYRGVTHYLENLLPRLKEGADATRARFQLADSYRQLASQQTLSLLLTESMSAETRQHHEKKHREWLQKAADEFAALEAHLESPRGKDHLTKDLRAQVPFITAKCWFNLAQFDKALKVYERLIDRYPGQVESLEALGGAVSCHAAVGDLTRVKQRLWQIQELLPKMPAEVREPWQEWVKEATRPLQKLDSAPAEDKETR